MFSKITVHAKASTFVAVLIIVLAASLSISKYYKSDNCRYIVRDSSSSYTDALRQVVSDIESTVMDPKYNKNRQLYWAFGDVCAKKEVRNRLKYVVPSDSYLCNSFSSKHLNSGEFDRIVMFKYASRSNGPFDRLLFVLGDTKAKKRKWYIISVLSSNALKYNCYDDAISHADVRKFP